MPNSRDQHTLIIPTYNRPKDLARNLRFLDAQGLRSRVIVLDSSDAKPREANRAAIEGLALDLNYVEYPSETSPFDKFADGVSRAETRFASLCADDDLLLLPGLFAAIQALERDAGAVCAHGYYCMFGFLQDHVNMDLTTMLYASPSITANAPLARLNTLMTSYQALTYGVFRTPVLQEIYKLIGSLDSLMFKELLSGALPVLRGKILRTPSFYMARQHATGDDAMRTRWHPYEWFMRDSPGFLAAYSEYRGILLGALDQGNTSADAATRGSWPRLVDLIHLRYLAKHFPDAAADVAIAGELNGETIDAYWPNPKLQQALLDAHNESIVAQASAGLLGRLVARAFDPSAIDEDGHVLAWPLQRATPVRKYRFYGALLDNRLSGAVEIDASIISELCRTLDAYPS